MFNMGGVRIPPLPMGILLVDRDDGTVWQLTHNSSQERVGIRDDAIPSNQTGQWRRYEAYDGPVLGSRPKIRLLVRGGRLGYEVIDLGQGVVDFDNQRILTRRGYENYILEILPLTWANPGDPIGFTTVDFP